MAAPQVPFAQAWRFWLKLGFISFGGPAGQIALMHAELVERRRWISERRFLHALNYCMLLPGPEAQQLATYLGWLMHRTWGGVLAGVLFVLPSLFILVGLAWVYLRFGDVPLVAGLLYGIKPAVVAVVLHAAWRIGTRALHNRWLLGIAVAAFVAIFVFSTPFPAIVLAAAAIGALGARVAPDVFAPGGAPAHASTVAGPGQPQDAGRPPALIDDDTPAPPHARYQRARLLRVLGLGLGLWAAAMAVLVAMQGLQGSLTQMGWFFTKAALLTFGGAYAVLPYVVQGAVDTYGWVTPTQMMDALALGESTPGPLIMVVAFVAFIGGYGQQLLGPQAPFLAGALAAVLVTFFTFLPSFIFILAGGPLVEATRGRLGFTAPLSAISAAVVGVIVNLALFFAGHVLWPQGAAAGIDVLAAALGLLAALALFRLRWGVIPVLAASAALGAVLKLAGG